MKIVIKIWHKIIISFRFDGGFDKKRRFKTQKKKRDEVSLITPLQ